VNKVALIALLPMLSLAQAPETWLPERQHVYEFKNVDAQRGEEVVGFVRSLMANQVIFNFEPAFKTAILWPNGNNNQPALLKAEELLKRYDVAPPAPPKVEFTAYLIRATTAEDARGAPNAQPVPAVVAEAIAEMKRTFPYTEYSLLDTAVTEVLHHTEVESLAPGLSLPGLGGVPMPYFYSLSYDDPLVTGKTVTLPRFQFTLRMPVNGANTQYQSSGITTEVSIHEGEKLVLGKVRLSLSQPAVVFLVLTVRLH